MEKREVPVKNQRIVKSSPPEAGRVVFGRVIRMAGLPAAGY